MWGTKAVHVEGIVTMFTGNYHTKTKIKLSKTVDAVTCIELSFGFFLFIVDIWQNFYTVPYGPKNIQVREIYWSVDQ